MNHVRKYRTKAKLTQSQLAALIGSSQQTIQRIEADAVTVRVEVAIALAGALRASLKALFPTIRKLDKIEAAQRRDERIDYSHCSHTLKMTFKGGPTRFYLVDQATATRVRECLLSDKKFVCFDTAGHAVAVHAAKLLWTNILFDPGELPEPKGEEDNLYKLDMYFDGSDEAHDFEIDPDSDEIDFDGDEGQSQLQFMMMELDGAAEDEMVSFVDGDGEEVIFSTARLKALEIPLGAVRPKLLEAIFEGIEEEDRAPGADV